MKEMRSDILRLIIAMNRLDGLYSMAAKTSGIKGNMLDLLYALDDGRPHTQKQICDEWLIPRTTLNTIVKECVRLGYVSLSGVEHSREKAIVVTPAGKDYTHAMMNDVYRAERSALHQAQQEYPVPFISAMEKFVDCLQTEFEKGVFRPQSEE